MKNKSSLALLLPETMSNPFSEERRALGKVLEIICSTDLRQDLVTCDLFISLRSRLTMLKMFQNLRNLSKQSGKGVQETVGRAARNAVLLSEVLAR